MKFSIDFGRWTANKAALAVAGALVIAGAVGSAVAFSPTVFPPIKWQGGAEFNLGVVGAGVNKVYTVPAGRNFLLTDLFVTNFSTAGKFFHVYSGAGGSCDPGDLVTRMNGLIAAPGSNTDLAFQTGIGFGAGQAVCIYSSDAVNYNGRGFLFTPQP